MQRWIQNGLIFTLALTAVSAGAVVAHNQGVKTAVLQRQAARHAAHEQFLVDRALCLNDTEVIQDECRDEAEDALEEELDLINEQFQARLDALELIGTGPYDPEIDPRDFSSDITNSLLPFVVGRTLVYEKVTPEGVEHIEVTTTNVVRTIGDVDCREVRDVGSFNGVVEEDTLDWVAQHEDGTVWYLGELSQNFGEDGLLEDIDGSWRTDVDGAKPGILMKPDPQVGDAYRQEYLLGEAEDMARVHALDQTVTVPAGVFLHCVAIDEWTPISPGAEHVERKYFAPGVGLVLAVHLASGEREELIAIQN